MNDPKQIPARWKMCLWGSAVSAMALWLLAKKWKLPGQGRLLSGLSIAFSTAAAAVQPRRTAEKAGSAWPVILGQTALSLAVFVTLLLARFWRDPERDSPQEDGLILSPADGEIVYIQSTPAGDLPMVTKQGRGYCLDELVGQSCFMQGAQVIGIEMNIMNVHVNRCPISGQVELLKRTRGAFTSLRLPEAPFINARYTTLLRRGTRDIAVVQIASRLVRRIDNYLAVGQRVRQGQRLGMIQFGSLVAVVIPAGQDIQVIGEVGWKVKAGITVLGRLPVSK